MHATVTPASNDHNLTHLTIRGRCAMFGAVTIEADLTRQEIRDLAASIIPAPTAGLLDLLDRDAIFEAVCDGIDNFDGGNMTLDVARALLAAGWTAVDCDDDVDYLAEVVDLAMPDPHKSRYWSPTQYATHITDELLEVLIACKVEVSA